MKRILFTLLALGGLSVGASTADAQWGYGYNYGYGHYHAPSVHYHSTFHPTYSHWTPYRGYHTHGHYHVTPHYTPGFYHGW